MAVNVGPSNSPESIVSTEVLIHELKSRPDLLLLIQGSAHTKRALRSKLQECISKAVPIAEWQLKKILEATRRALRKNEEKVRGMPGEMKRFGKFIAEYNKRGAPPPISLPVKVSSEELRSSSALDLSWGAGLTPILERLGVLPEVKPLNAAAVVPSNTAPSPAPKRVRTE